MSLKDF